MEDKGNGKKENLSLGESKVDVKRSCHIGKSDEESDCDDKVAKNITTENVQFASPAFLAPKKTALKRKPQTVVKKKYPDDEESSGKELKTTTIQNVTSVTEQSPEKSEYKTEKPEQQDLSQRKPCVPFSCPSWCTTCPKDYVFEILKNGVIKGKLDMTEKPFFIFGRLEGCDVLLEHPSISRYHAVVVYRGALEKGSKIEEGFYVMDLGSTHGTVVNKIALQPHVYHRIRVGYVVKFGASSRLYVLQGPEDDQDEEVGMNIVKDKREIDKSEEDEEQTDENVEDAGISWGMSEDAVEEEIDLEKLLASRKPLELKDPKKTLRGFFEREGLELEYESDERGTGHTKVFVIRVRLPIEDAAGQELLAEGTSTKKKDAVVACAYEACRIIDAHGMLRNAIHESERSKRAKRLADNDYYDSDEDTFLDRTGAVESKRQKRLKKAGQAAKETVETYDSLTEALETTLQEIKSLEKSLSDDQNAEKRISQDDGDELDQFMNTVESRLDKKTRISMKHRLSALKKEQRRVEKLLEIVKPVELPPLKAPQSPLVEKKNDGPEIKEKAKVEQNNVDKVIIDQEKAQDGAKHVKAERSKPNECNKPTMNYGSSLVDVISRINPSSEESEKVEQHPRQKQKTKKKIYGAQMTPDSTSKFDAWIPPEGQTGDGKTHLNERFGY